MLKFYHSWTSALLLELLRKAYLTPSRCRAECRDCTKDICQCSHKVCNTRAGSSLFPRCFVSELMPSDPRVMALSVHRSRRDHRFSNPTLSGFSSFHLCVSRSYSSPQEISWAAICRRPGIPVLLVRVPDSVMGSLERRSIIAKQNTLLSLWLIKAGRARAAICSREKWNSYIAPLVDTGSRYPYRQLP